MLFTFLSDFNRFDGQFKQKEVSFQKHQLKLRSQNGLLKINIYTLAALLNSFILPNTSTPNDKNL